jgi:hypothetical protein
MKKVALLCLVVFAAALASADTINLTFGAQNITTQGTWGFNNSAPSIFLSLNPTYAPNGGGTAQLRLGSVVLSAANVTTAPFVSNGVNNIYQTYCNFGCRSVWVGSQSYGYDSNSPTGTILGSSQLIPCFSGHVHGTSGDCRVTGGSFAFNYGGSYSYGYYGNSSSNWLNSGNVHINEVAAVPEPRTLGLMGTGLVGLAFLAKRKLAAAAFMSAA